MWTQHRTVSSSCSSWTNFSTASHSCEHPARDRHFLAPARPNYIQKNGATVTGLEQADSSFGFFLAKMKPSTRRLSEAGSGCLFLSCLLVQLLNQTCLRNSPRFPTMHPGYDSSRGPAFPFSSAATCYGKPSIPGVICTTAPLYHFNISCKEELIHYHLESRRGLYYSLVIGKETRTPTRDASSMRITTHVGVCRRQVHICSERTEWRSGPTTQSPLHFTWY